MSFKKMAGLLVSGVLLLAGCGQTQNDAAPPPTIPSDAARIADISVIDLSGDEAAIQTSKDILVMNGRILSVETHVPAATAVIEIDGAGLYAMPGLYDMHVHIWDEDVLGAYLAYGQTTIRNLSGMPFHLDVKARLEAGALDGPRLLTTGPILNSQGPNAQLNHQIVETGEDARAAVRAHYETGYRDLKVYSNLTREAYEAIRDEADALGLSISGHTPEGRRDDGVPFDKPFNISFDELLDDGFLTFEHIETMAWHGLEGRHDRDGAVALAHKIAASGTPVTTTLLAHHNLLRVAQTKGAYADRKNTNLLNPFIQKMEQTAIEHWSTERDPDQTAEANAFFADVAAIFQREGVTLVAGTDAGIFTNIPGVSLIEEMELLANAGLSRFEALKAATWNPAVVLDESDEHGRIAPGYVADLVVYACNPLEDLNCMRAPVGVMRGGTWFDAGALAAMLETARSQNVERTQTNAFAGLAAQGVSLKDLQ